MKERERKRVCVGWLGEQSVGVFLPYLAIGLPVPFPLYMGRKNMPMITSTSNTHAVTIKPKEPA
jgi:hypothetical protein